MNKDITGMIVGVFDLFNVGYLRLFERCKDMCDYLIVGVCEDEYVSKIKKTTPINSHENRRRIIEALKCVDEVIDVSIEETLDKRLLLHKHPFNVLFSGDDWKGTPRYQRTEEDFAKCGVEIVYFPHIVGFSVPTTRIEESFRDNEV